MTARRMTTYSLKESEIRKAWHVLDARGQTLGRLASQAAALLRGKHKVTYSPHLDMGDYVVIINAEAVRVTGNKRQDKVYYRHSGYPGGLRGVTLEELLATRPDSVMRYAVAGMLPHNRLGRRLLSHLKVYAGPAHPHQAQVAATLNSGGTSIGSRRPR